MHAKTGGLLLHLIHALYGRHFLSLNSEKLDIVWALHRQVHIESFCAKLACAH
jgi:hypothetical protein